MSSPTFSSADGTQHCCLQPHPAAQAAAATLALQGQVAAPPQVTFDIEQGGEVKGPLEEGQQGREYQPDAKPLARTQTLGKARNGSMSVCTTVAALPPSCRQMLGKVASGMHLYARLLPRLHSLLPGHKCWKR